MMEQFCKHAPSWSITSWNGLFGNKVEAGTIYLLIVTCQLKISAKDLVQHVRGKFLSHKTNPVFGSSKIKSIN